jgi:hypothetical protein
MRCQKLALTALYFNFAILGAAQADTVDVKHRGPVDLASLECTAINRSSLVTRVCYLARKSYLVIGLKKNYYHYCDVDAKTVRDFLAAPSMGRFYNASIKDSGTGGKFSCRDKTPPAID